MKKWMLAMALLLSPMAAVAIEVETVKMPVLLESIKKGQIITAGMLGEREFPIRHVSGQVVHHADELVGMQAVRPMGKNRMVYTNAVRLTPVVQRSSNVMMVYKTPTIQVLATGTSMQDGMVGDFVKVMNSQSKQVVMAHVVAPNKVEVK